MQSRFPANHVRSRNKLLPRFPVGIMLIGVLLGSSVVAPAADAPALAVRQRADEALIDLLDIAQRKLVKLYGAGRMQNLESYQSGFFISDQGHILTSWSTVLDVDSVRIVTWDGKRWDATLVGVDPKAELAVLKIDAEGFAHFALNPPAEARPGDRVFGLSNLFGIATGNEHSSVQQGNVMATATLNAKRGRLKTLYQGSVYVLDLISNNPGATGGALVDLHGRLIGMLGKELRDERTNVYLNYAIPASVLSESVASILRGTQSAQSAEATRKIEHPHRLFEMGIVMIPNVLPKTPAFVDQIGAGSLAERAGIKPNDLLLLVNGRRADSQRSVDEILASIERHDNVTFTVQRDNELITIEIRP